MSKHYRYTTKDSNGYRPNTVTSDEYNSAEYGTIFIEEYPFKATLSFDFFPNITTWPQFLPFLDETPRIRLSSLKTAFSRNIKYSKYFQKLDLDNENICLISIPSIFYGSGIERGSVSLATFGDGILLSKLEDVNRNGELVHTEGTATGLVKGTVCGLILYEEGFILLFDDTSLASYTEKFYDTKFPSNLNINDTPKWYNFGISLGAQAGSVTKTTYDLNFRGINEINQITLLAYAPKGMLNNSSNPTFLDFSEKNLEEYKVIYENGSYIERNNKKIKNITKTDYASPEPTMQKETYINKIVIYDENKIPIAVANLATPVRKTEDRDFLFKLKLDI